jgi:hypothetical protein
MPNSHDNLEYYYKKARDNGRTTKEAFQYALKKINAGKYKNDDFERDEDSQANLALELQDTYNECRDRGMSRAGAWASAQDHLKSYMMNCGARGPAHCSGPLDDLADMFDALPGCGSLFGDDVHRSRAHTGERPNVRVREYTYSSYSSARQSYTDGPPTPAGRGEYAFPAPQYPSQTFRDASNGHRVFEPSGQDWRGAAYDKVSGSYSYSSKDQSRYTDDRSPPSRPSHGPSARSHSYQTEDRRPRGEYSSRPEPSSRPKPSTYSSSRSYRTEDRRPGDYSSHRSDSDRYRSSRAHPSSSNGSSSDRAPSDDNQRPSICFYRLLGISRDATPDEIKKAYRKLSLLNHPDRVIEADKANANAKFQDINTANQILSDPEKRVYYDRTGYIPRID